MWSPGRTRTSLSFLTSLIQVRVLLPRKGNIRHPFLLKPAHHKREPAFWALGLVFYLTRRRGHP